MGFTASLRIAVVALVCASPALFWGEPSVLGGTPDGHLDLDGVGNFGRVSEHLYRGAQPEPEAFASLRRLGIDTVVKLNGESEPREKQLVEAQGMRFIELPWSAERAPTHEQVLTFLTLLHDHPDDNVFVHCRAGADRTGVMVALYRMEFDHWTAAQAVSEMKLFHYHHLLLPHLENYVESFPVVTAGDEEMRKLASPVSGTEGSSGVQ